MQADKCKVNDDAAVSQNKNMNATFHIYSTEGRSISTYIGFNTPLDQATGKTILFPSGSQFLVCKREIVENQLHIYLRQVNLGLGHSIMFWADEKVFGFPYKKYMLWTQHAQKMAKSSFDRDKNYIFKSDP